MYSTFPKKKSGILKYLGGIFEANFRSSDPILAILDLLDSPHLARQNEPKIVKIGPVNREIFAKNDHFRLFIIPGGYRVIPLIFARYPGYFGP